jgi:hypothetical protein
MAAATHRGHCQLCGSLQKLPKGRLSLHGYTVAHGYFSGTCRGAKGLPFEQSINLILDEMDFAKKSLKMLRDNIKELRTHVDEQTRMWVHTYIPYANGHKSYYVWEPVTLRADMPPAETDGWQRITYTYTRHGGKDTTVSGVAPYEMPGATCEELRRATVLKLNRTYVDCALVKQEKTLVRYLSWLDERIKNWKEQPLLPIDAKDDKQAFNPEEK